MMKKFINEPTKLVDELLEGYALAYKDYVHLKPGHIVVNNNLEKTQRVTVVSIGGTGHEPCATGFVGEGMLDVFIGGEIFTAPGVKATLDGVKLADRGNGVLLIVLNHAGDMLTGKQVLAECHKQGMKINMVVVQDDISAAPRTMAGNRRGLVGCIPVYKIAGAAATAGKNLEEVTVLAQRMADQIATLAVGLKGAIHPVTGELLANLGPDEMEIGMGQHGEEGGGRQKLLTADQTIDIMLPALLQDLKIKSSEKVLLLLNGSGATTLMELCILYRRCAFILKEKNIEIVADKIGELLTVQDAAGFQLLLGRMDDELLSLWDAKCNAPYFKHL